jgi:hypothetical protein
LGILANEQILIGDNRANWECATATLFSLPLPPVHSPNPFNDCLGQAMWKITKPKDGFVANSSSGELTK